MYSFNLNLCFSFPATLMSYLKLLRSIQLFTIHCTRTFQMWKWWKEPNSEGLAPPLTLPPLLIKGEGRAGPTGVSGVDPARLWPSS